MKTLKQIAEKYRVPQSYIMLLVKAGKIPYYGFRCSPLFKEKEVAASLITKEEFNRLSELF